MAYSPTTLLSLPIITTGTESGAWGNVTNNGLTQYLDIAIAGSLSLTTDADVDLSNTAGTDTVTNIGSTTAQYMVLNCTGSRTVTRNINAPKQSKLYVVINATTGSQSVVLRGGPTSPTTGVTVANGSTALCAWNGSDYVLIGSSISLSANNAFTGANTFYNATGQTFSRTSANDGIVLQGRSGGTSSYRVTFTTGTLSASRTVTLPNADINFTTGLGVANGGTGATTLTANNVILGNGTSAVQFVAPSTSGNVLTSNGTTWTSAAGLLGQTDSGSPFETSFGYQAGNVNTGSSNTFIGYQAGVANTNGSSNVALGARALDANTTGTNNVAIGADALDLNTTGGFNIAIGSAVLSANTTGTSNVGIGGNCLVQSTNSNNVAIGTGSMYALTTGANNTAIGTQAADSLTTGTGNVIIGSYADASAAGGVDQIVIGYYVTGQANTNVTIGNSSGKIYNAYTVNATWTQTSDGTMKNIIGPDTLGLSFIKRLNPIKFTWKPQNELPIDHPYYKEINGRDTNVVVHGFVAQEVKAALDAEGCTTFNGWDQGSDGIQAISREMFVSPLVKAIQELSEQIEILKEEIVLLKASS